MIKIAALLLASFAVAGCQTEAGTLQAEPVAMKPPSQADEAKAKAAVKRVLKDPSSAMFEGLFTHPGAVCGFVNSKNSFGGYVGRRPFGYIIDQDVAYVLDSGTTTMAHSTVSRYCVR